MIDFEPYEMSEADVDKTIVYLKTLGHENPTPEDAISYLQQYQAKFRALNRVLTEEEMIQLYDEFASGKTGENV